MECLLILLIVICSGTTTATGYKEFVCYYIMMEELAPGERALEILHVDGCVEQQGAVAAGAAGAAGAELVSSLSCTRLSAGLPAGQARLVAPEQSLFTFHQPVSAETLMEGTQSPFVIQGLMPHVVAMGGRSTVVTPLLLTPAAGASLLLAGDPTLLRVRQQHDGGYAVNWTGARAVLFRPLEACSVPPAPAATPADVPADVPTYIEEEFRRHDTPRATTVRAAPPPARATVAGTIHEEFRKYAVGGGQRSSCAPPPPLLLAAPVLCFMLG